VIRTANAKRCDITGEYYEMPKKKRQIIIQIVSDNGKVTTPDIGPTLYEKIEKLITVKPIRKKLKKRKKRRKNRKKKLKPRKTKVAVVKKVAPLKKKKPYNKTPKMEYVMMRADKLEKRGMTRKRAREQAAKDWDTKQKNNVKLKRDNEYMERVKPKPKNTTNDNLCVVCGDKASTDSDLCLTCRDGCESFNGVKG